MAMVALPPLKVLAPELNPEAISVTEPVGMIPPPLTVTFTESACAVVMVDADGETVTAGTARG